MNPSRKSLRETLLWLAIVLLVAMLAFSNCPGDGKRHPTIGQRVTAWFLGIPLRQEPPEEEAEDELPIESAYIVHNAPPEREVDSAGHVKLDHGFGW